jgi:hypothetical protein
MIQLEEFLEKCVRAGADAIEMEYNAGYEELYAKEGNVGFGARIPSSSPEAALLRQELHGMARKKRQRMVVDGVEYELRASTYDSFGETAYRVKIIPAKKHGLRA